MVVLSSVMSSQAFLGIEGFCPHCGSILPILSSKGSVECYVCKHVFDPISSMECSYTVHFNSRESRAEAIHRQKEEKKKSSGLDGPVVEKKCLKCGNDKMTYTTLQLRSADEGQTVFYTCTNCGHKETENS